MNILDALRPLVAKLTGRNIEEVPSTNKTDVIKYLNDNYVSSCGGDINPTYDDTAIKQDISDIQDDIDNNITPIVESQTYTSIQPGNNGIINVSSWSEKELYQKRYICATPLTSDTTITLPQLSDSENGDPATPPSHPQVVPDRNKNNFIEVLLQVNNNITLHYQDGGSYEGDFTLSSGKYKFIAKYNLLSYNWQVNIYNLADRISDTISNSNTIDLSKPLILFEKTKDFNGAQYFRIPAITVTNKGTILAVADVRYNGAGDQTFIDIGCARSIDGGKTWNKYIVVENSRVDNTRSRVMDSTILSTKSGKTFILVGSWDRSPNNWTTATTSPDPDWKAYMCVSNDDGLTFTKNNISNIMLHGGISFLGGVGSGIEMQNGTLVMPIQIAWLNKSPKVQSGLIYSKDDGTIWTMAGGFTPRSCSENNIVEIEPGVLVNNCRADGWGRASYISYDLGETWEEFEPLNGKISNGNSSPKCQGSFIGINLGDNQNIGLVTTPKNLKGNYIRDNITLYLTDFNAVQEFKILYPKDGNASGGGYSCLAYTDFDKEPKLYFLYEADGNIEFMEITKYLPQLVINGITPELKRNKNKVSDLEHTVNLLLNEHPSIPILKTTNLVLNLADRIEITLGNSEGTSTGTWYDNSGNNNNFSLTNVTKEDRYIVFSGNTTSIGKLHKTLVTNNFTVEFTFIPTANTMNPDWSTVLALGNFKQIPKLGIALGNNKTLNPMINGNGSTQTGQWAPNTEYHICMMYSTTSGFKLYVNNVETYTNTSLTTSAINYTDITIGQLLDQIKRTQMKIRDIRIYDTILTDIERTRNYNYSINL